MDIIHAVHSLKPGAQWFINGESYDGLTWLDKTQTKPTEAEIEAEIQKLQAEYEATEYQRQRAPEYPDLKELADALYWNSKGDSSKLEEYYIKCEEIKNKYPKPQ